MAGFMICIYNHTYIQNFHHYTSPYPKLLDTLIFEIHRQLGLRSWQRLHEARTAISSLAKRTRRGARWTAV